MQCFVHTNLYFIINRSWSYTKFCEWWRLAELHRIMPEMLSNRLTSNVVSNLTSTQVQATSLFSFFLASDWGRLPAGGQLWRAPGTPVLDDRRVTNHDKMFNRGPHNLTAQALPEMQQWWDAFTCKLASSTDCVKQNNVMDIYIHVCCIQPRPSASTQKTNTVLSDLRQNGLRYL